MFIPQPFLNIYFVSIAQVGNGQQSGREIFMRFEKGQETLGNHLYPIEDSLTELVQNKQNKT